MTFHQLLRILLSIQLLNTFVSCLPFDHASSGQTPLQTSPFPRHSPAQPWNNHICRRPAVWPNLHLTFNFGVHKPRRLAAGKQASALVTTFHSSREASRAAIARGYGDRQIHSVYPMAFNREHEIGINVYPFRGGGTGLEPFTVMQASQAVELLRLCGIARKREQKMWAYVFVKERRIGYIVLDMDQIEPLPDGVL